jgi:transposase
MASIIKKNIKGNSYYYYVESKRVDGKPRPVNQHYLGSAERILMLATNPAASLQEKALFSDVEDFGDVMIVWDIARRLDIAGTIDRHCPKRSQGASVGQYIVTEAVNRAVAPVSTSSIRDWYSHTALPLATGLPSGLFTAQDFWNNTDIPESALGDIEEDILASVLKTYGIGTGDIIYDATNFFTFIDTGNPCALARRGHDKAKRNDLRTVGLAMMVTPDFSVPLLSEAYPGNSPDSKEFAVMMGGLRKRIERIAGKDVSVTVVFDRGNGSESNLDLLGDKDIPFHYVTGLKRNQSDALFAIGKGEYKGLEGEELKGQSACRREDYEAFGRKGTALIVHNPALRDGQMQGILINIGKTTERLVGIQSRLLDRASGKTKGGKKPTTESVASAVGKVLKTEYMGRIFSFQVVSQDGNPLLTFSKSDSELERLDDAELGKTVLFTDRKDLSDEQIVLDYRSAWHIEHGFRQMKDTSHLSVRPIFHWTDRRIRIHLFTCVLAFRLCCLLRKELSDKGIALPIDRMLDEMSALKSVTTFVGDIDKPGQIHTFSKCSELADKIERTYNLKEKYGVR